MTCGGLYPFAYIGLATRSCGYASLPPHDAPAARAAAQQPEALRFATGPGRSTPPDGPHAAKIAEIARIPMEYSAIVRIRLKFCRFPAGEKGAKPVSGTQRQQRGQEAGEKYFLDSRIPHCPI